MFAIETATNKVALTTVIGPLANFITGTGSLDKNVLTFRWTEINIQLFGIPLYKRSLSSGDKTYSFFHSDALIACAESSLGGCALLARRP